MPQCTHVSTLTVVEEGSSHVHPQAVPHHVVIGFDLPTDVSIKSPRLSDHHQAAGGGRSPRSVLEPVHQFVERTISPRSALTRSFSGSLKTTMKPPDQQKMAEESQYNFRAYCGFDYCLTEGRHTWPFSTREVVDTLIPCVGDIDYNDDDAAGADDEHSSGRSASSYSETDASGEMYDKRHADYHDRAEDYDVYGHSLNYKRSIFCTGLPTIGSYKDPFIQNEFPEVDFLSQCFYCKKHLEQGKDTYMYRGDRAFCSQECRYQQIVIDEG